MYEKTCFFKNMCILVHKKKSYSVMLLLVILPQNIKNDSLHGCKHTPT